MVIGINLKKASLIFYGVLALKSGHFDNSELEVLNQIGLSAKLTKIFNAFFNPLD
jgi:hypothetical protein